MQMDAEEAIQKNAEQIAKEMATDVFNVKTKKLMTYEDMIGKDRIDNAYTICMQLADKNVKEADNYYENYSYVDVYDKYIYKLTLEYKQS